MTTPPYNPASAVEGIPIAYGVPVDPGTHFDEAGNVIAYPDNPLKGRLSKELPDGSCKVDQVALATPAYPMNVQPYDENGIPICFPAPVLIAPPYSPTPSAPPMEDEPQPVSSLPRPVRVIQNAVRSFFTPDDSKAIKELMSCNDMHTKIFFNGRREIKEILLEGGDFNNLTAHCSAPQLLELFTEAVENQNTDLTLSVVNSLNERIANVKAKIEHAAKPSDLKKAHQELFELYKAKKAIIQFCVNDPGLIEELNSDEEQFDYKIAHLLLTNEPLTGIKIDSDLLKTKQAREHYGVTQRCTEEGKLWDVTTRRALDMGLIQGAEDLLINFSTSYQRSPMSYSVSFTIDEHVKGFVDLRRKLAPDTKSPTLFSDELALHPVQRVFNKIRMEKAAELIAKFKDNSFTPENLNAFLHENEMYFGDQDTCNIKIPVTLPSMTLGGRSTRVHMNLSDIAAHFNRQDLKDALPSPLSVHTDEFIIGNSYLFVNLESCKAHQSGGFGGIVYSFNPSDETAKFKIGGHRVGMPMATVVEHAKNHSLLPYQIEGKTHLLEIKEYRGKVEIVVSEDNFFSDLSELDAAIYNGNIQYLTECELDSNQAIKVIQAALKTNNLEMLEIALNTKNLNQDDLSRLAIQAVKNSNRSEYLVNESLLEKIIDKIEKPSQTLLYAIQSRIYEVGAGSKLIEVLDHLLEKIKQPARSDFVLELYYKGEFRESNYTHQYKKHDSPSLAKVYAKHIEFDPIVTSLPPKEKYGNRKKLPLAEHLLSEAARNNNPFALQFLEECHKQGKLDFNQERKNGLKPLESLILRHHDQMPQINESETYYQGYGYQRNSNYSLETHPTYNKAYQLSQKLGYQERDVPVRVVNYGTFGRDAQKSTYDLNGLMRITALKKEAYATSG